MEQALPLQSEWLNFNRMRVRIDQPLPLGGGASLHVRWVGMGLRVVLACQTCAPASSQRQQRVAMAQETLVWLVVPFLAATRCAMTPPAGARQAQSSVTCLPMKRSRSAVRTVCAAMPRVVWALAAAALRPAQS